MSKSNIIGYISFIAGVIIIAITFSIFEANAEGTLMVDTFFCISSACFSRADIFFPIFGVGYILLALGIALLSEHIINNLRRMIFG